MAIHQDTICTQKAGTRINTAVVSFIYVCPACGAEWRFARPKPKEDVIHNGEEWTVDNFKKRRDPIVDEDISLEKLERKRIKNLLKHIDDDIIPTDENGVAELENLGLIRKKRKFELTELGVIKASE